MKWYILCLTLLVFLFGCTGKTIRLDEQSAKVGIHEWDKTPTKDAWIVIIWYDIENTGTLDITSFSIHVTIDVEGSKTVTSDCWGPSKTVENYRAKKAGAAIPPGKTERCVVVLDIPYKPMRVAIELEEFK